MLYCMFNDYCTRLLKNIHQMTISILNISIRFITNQPFFKFNVSIFIKPFHQIFIILFATEVLYRFVTEKQFC